MRARSVSRQPRAKPPAGRRKPDRAYADAPWDKGSCWATGRILSSEVAPVYSSSIFVKI